MLFVENKIIEKEDAARLIRKQIDIFACDMGRDRMVELPVYILHAKVDSMALELAP